MKLAIVLCLLACAMCTAYGAKFRAMSVGDDLELPVIEGGGPTNPKAANDFSKILETQPPSATVGASAEFQDVFKISDAVDDLMEEDGSISETMDLDSATNPFKSDKIKAASAEEQQLKDEMSVLEQLIERGDAIVHAMPAKEQRLKELKDRFENAESTIATEKAAETLAEQESLLKEVEGQISTLQKKVDELTATKEKLEAGIEKTKKLQSGSGSGSGSDSEEADGDDA